MIKKYFNGRLVTKHLLENSSDFHALQDATFGKKLTRNYFEKRKTINSDTLWKLSQIFGWPLDMFFIAENESDPDITNPNSQCVFHHNKINTVNAQTNSEVLFALLQSNQQIVAMKDEQIRELQDRYTELMKKIPNAAPVHPDIM